MEIKLNDKKTIEDIIELIASKFEVGYTVESFIDTSYGISSLVHQGVNKDPKVCLIAGIVLLSSLPNGFFVKEYGFSKLDMLDVLKDIIDDEIDNPIHKRLNDLVNSQSKIIC